MSTQSNLEKALDIAPIKEEDEKSLPTEAKENLPEKWKGFDIETSVEDVYERGMEAFEEQVNNASIVEPRYAARNMEVAKGFLDTALEAAKLVQKDRVDEAKIAIARARFNLPQVAGDLVQNKTVIIADRNEIIKALRDGKPRNDFRKETEIIIDEEGVDELAEVLQDDIIDGEIEDTKNES
jgi:hypothetical protein